MTDGREPHFALGQREVHEDRIKRLQCCDLLTGRQELADIDKTDADVTVEGRADLFFVDECLLGCHLRFGVLQIGCGCVELRLADGAAAHKFAAAVIGEAGEIDGGVECL